MHLNLIVIKTLNIHKLAKQYKLLGLNFEYHKHGNGPFHYASELNHFVFEIYPLPQTDLDVNKNIRLGFSVPDLKTVLDSIKNSTWLIKSELKQDRSYAYAIIQDLDGRVVELNEL